MRSSHGITCLVELRAPDNITRIAEGYDPEAGPVKKENWYRSIEIFVDEVGYGDRDLI